jgi:hypothetical protein
VAGTAVIAGVVFTWLGMVLAIPAGGSLAGPTTCSRVRSTTAASTASTRFNSTPGGTLLRSRVHLVHVAAKVVKVVAGVLALSAR